MSSKLRNKKDTVYLATQSLWLTLQEHFGQRDGVEARLQGAKKRVEGKREEAATVDNIFR